ncbi:hypothetical protein Tco_0716818, partial [Tanacetum coccineum]
VILSLKYGAKLKIYVSQDRTNKVPQSKGLLVVHGWPSEFSDKFGSVSLEPKKEGPSDRRSMSTTTYDMLLSQSESASRILCSTGVLSKSIPNGLYSVIHQKALDDALVAPENRLKIGKCNQRLSPTLKSNEPTIQVALDALKLTPFYNAFEVSTDVPEIYMQEDMLKICPKLRGQKFEDSPFEEEILSFIRDLGHTSKIKVLSNVNVNHLHQPWRSFAAIINKYLVYQVKNKNSKKNNDMYYPRFTKVIIDYFMAKNRAIPKRNKMFWHYARDDLMFTTIRVISKHQDTHVYAAILPQHLTNQDMLESKAYKTYRAYATSEKTLKPKSTKKKADSESSLKTKPIQDSKGKRIKTSAKGDIPAKKIKTQQHSSHVSGSGADEGTGVTPGVPDVPSYDSEAEQISWKSSDEEDDDDVNIGDDNDDDTDNQDDDGQEYDEQDDDNQDDDDQEHDDQDDEEQDDVNEKTDSDNDGDDFVHPKLSTHDEEDKEEDDSDPRIHTPSNYESTDDDEIQGANVEGEEMDEEETNEKDEANELYKDVNVNLEGRDTKMTDAPRVSSIPGIVDVYLADKIHEAVKTVVQLQSDRLRDEAQAKNADFINKLDDNIKKIIKDQVKEQVKAQVSKILPKIEKTVNEQLEAVVLTRSSNESKTSHAVVANLSELELKKILIDKIESNKSIHRSDEQKNLYKALVDTYESDKLILDTYGETISFKRRQDEEDKDEEPFVGSNRGSKRRRARKEPESTSTLKEKTSKTTGKSTEVSKSHKSADESTQAEETMQTAKDLEEPAHQEFKTGVTKDQPDEETSQLPDWFQKPTKPPTPNRDWNKTFPDAHGPV